MHTFSHSTMFATFWDSGPLAHRSRRLVHKCTDFTERLDKIIADLSVARLSGGAFRRQVVGMSHQLVRLFFLIGFPTHSRDASTTMIRMCGRAEEGTVKQVLGAWTAPEGFPI